MNPSIGHTGQKESKKALRIAFIGIGVSKAGTSTIARLLDEHPQVCLSIPKEVNFFCDNTDNLYGYPERPFDQLGLAWYYQHFKHCSPDAIKGEFSNHYFTDGQAPQRIRQTFPDAKLILCLRHPVERAFSNFLFRQEHGYDTKLSFREACQLHAEILVEKGFYHKYLTRWLQYFPKSQIFTIVLEEFKKEPGRVLSHLYDFIGVDAGFVPANLYERKNEYRKSRVVWLRKLEAKVAPALGSHGLSAAVHWLKKKGVNHLVRKLVTKPAKNYPVMNGEDKAWLQELYADDIARLEKLLGKYLSAWKT